MRMGNYSRLFSRIGGAILGLFLVFISSLASAQDYFWQWGGIATWAGPSPFALCTKYGPQTTNPNSSSFQFHSASASFSGVDRVICDVTWRSSRSDGTFNDTFRSHVIDRYGNGCTSPFEYDSKTGECVGPSDPCEVKKGVQEGFSKAGTAPDPFMIISSTGFAIPQRQGCKDGCAVEVEPRCKTMTSGQYFCSGRAFHTGLQCATSGTGDQVLAEETSENPQPQVIKEDKPCVYSTDGSKQVCTSTVSEEQQGQSCGTANGKEICVSKQPSKNGIDIRTEVTKEILADGSVITTKTDIATVTKCKGVKDCKTSTATTTTTTKTDGKGNTVSAISTCTGSACGSSSNPDKTGDGLGECMPGEACNGEGIGAQGWYEPEGDTFAGVLKDFKQGVMNTPIATQTTKFFTFSASGACPRWSIEAWVFSFDFDQFCGGDIPWAAIKAVILAVAAYISFRIAFL